jgi:hypothetical protein
VDVEIQSALQAARDDPLVLEHVERAVALATFTADDPHYGPIRREPPSDGVPQPPARPRFPAFAHVPRTPLTEALEALQAELVWAADCAEYSDATNNAAQYLRAAGSLDLAHQVVLVSHSPGFGFVLAPPRQMWGLAAGLGRQLEDLGLPMMGSLVTPELSADFRWDIHHEEPVRTARALGPKELTSYRVHFAHGRAACEPLIPDGEWFRVTPAAEDAFTLEWYAEEPAWAMPPPDPRALQALVARLETADALDDNEFEFRPPVSARALADALQAQDAFVRTVDVHQSHWRLVVPSGYPRIGAWTVHASLEGPATGERIAGDFPAAAARTLGDEDRVRRLTVVKA